jgi:hypothetical protein
MASRIARFATLALLLWSSGASASALRVDLAEAYGAWQPPAPAAGADHRARAVGLDLQVPRHLGCVRTRDPSTGVTLRCATDPAHGSAQELSEQQRATERGVRPLLFLDLGSVVAMRLREHLELRFEQVDVDRGPIPVTVRLKYDVHNGRFGERDMRVELSAQLEQGPLLVQGHSRERLNPAHLAWFVPTLPLAGAGLIMLDRLDREAIAEQALRTIDEACAQLAEALVEQQRERGLRPPALAEPAPPPSPAASPPSPAPSPAAPPPRPAPSPAALEPAVASTRPEPPLPPLPKRPSRCEDTPAASLTSLTSEAVVAFVTHDDDAFERAADRAAQALPCVDEVVLPPQAAEFHRLVALRAWYAGDRQAAELAFRASLAVEPSYRLSEKVAPPGGGLRRAWERAQEAPRSRMMPLEGPEDVRAWVDGFVAEDRPMDLPALVQLGAPPDRVGWTGYLGPGGALPGPRGGSNLALIPFSFIRSASLGSEQARWGLPVAVEQPEPPTAPPPRAPVPVEDLAALPPPTAPVQPLLTTAVATGSAAVVLYGTAHLARWRFDHHGPTQALMWTTNGCYLGSIGLGLTSATFTTLWLQRRER